MGTRLEFFHHKAADYDIVSIFQYVAGTYLRDWKKKKLCEFVFIYVTM